MHRRGDLWGAPGAGTGAGSGVLCERGIRGEALTGDHRRDFHGNRLLRACQVGDVTEPCAREAARLRTATGQAAAISAADAIVAAVSSANPPVRGAPHRYPLPAASRGTRRGHEDAAVPVDDR